MEILRSAVSTGHSRPHRFFSYPNNDISVCRTICYISKVFNRSFNINAIFRFRLALTCRIFRKRCPQLLTNYHYRSWYFAQRIIAQSRSLLSITIEDWVSALARHFRFIVHKNPNLREIHLKVATHWPLVRKMLRHLPKSLEAISYASSFCLSRSIQLSYLTGQISLASTLSLLWTQRKVSLRPSE
jgi:hypothetical protein